jgi:uncharacterized protein (DUF3820 family)
MISKTKRVPVEELKQTISYDDTLNLFERKREAISCINPINKNKQNEFMWILEKQTGSPFNEIEWEQDYFNGESQTLCICSKNIELIYTIKHVPTNQSFVVGSECIKKISKNLYNKIFKEKCRVCNSVILDKRTKLGKNNICSYSCNNGIFRFGNNKNKTITEVPKNYCEWLYKQHWVKDTLKELIKTIVLKI